MTLLPMMSHVATLRGAQRYLLDMKCAPRCFMRRRYTHKTQLSCMFTSNTIHSQMHGSRKQHAPPAFFLRRLMPRAYRGRCSMT